MPFSLWSNGGPVGPLCAPVTEESVRFLAITDRILAPVKAFVNIFFTTFSIDFANFGFRVSTYAKLRH